MRYFIMAKNQKATEAHDEQAPAETFDDIGGVSKNVETKEVDLFESYPSFVPDKNWKIGRTLAGVYVSSKKVFSDKLTAGRIDKETGKMCRMLHALEDANGNRFALWGTGTLDLMFSRAVPGQYLEITLTGKADKPLKPGQSAPYLFTVKSDRDFVDADEAKAAKEVVKEVVKEG
jgi:hypothetical protein